MSPAAITDTGFAYHAPTQLLAKAGIQWAWAMRAMPIMAAMALVIVPEQAGNSAIIDHALPKLATARQGEETVLPTAKDTQFAVVAAAPFSVSYSDAISPRLAEDCLTQAIYYEGALEPELGQRAIAQVVLNRVRHPEYPNSVCGVVFQGQHLPTGCQFTFTCDGSRARAPMPSIWRKANLIAKAALGGTVVKEVGLSTHYHADYVQPYWSSSLDLTGQIGRHIFYRWRGQAGRPAAFASAYSGREPLIAEWVPRPAIETDASILGASLQLDAGAGSSMTPVPDTIAAPPAPLPFKARPLRLATGEDKAP